ncbi:MAG: ribosome small subunit-dependent GTPase A [Bacteroidota bacterium]
MSAALDGWVFKSTGSWYRVRMADGHFLDCRVRGKFKLSKLKTTNPVAVGDKVKVTLDEKHPGTGIITEMIPRENYVVRKSVHKTDHSHLLAANIDQAIVMGTIKQPKTSMGFIDRFLVSTEAYRIPSIVLINKTDIYNEEDQFILEEITSIYKKAGVETYAISIKENIGIDKVKELLLNKITLFAGHSGTGKSTLMNTLHPDINQDVAEVSSFADKGVHTTTFAEMFELDKSTFVIDTPGIKELGLIDIGNHELSDYFPEMRKLLGKCKFHNCSHTHEPKCAVIQAVETGEISLSRYKSYISMLENVDTRR